MRVNHTYRTLAVLGVCAALVVGCKKEEGASSGGTPNTAVAFNASCPVMTENGVSLKTPTVDYNGVTIGFCCADCIETWNGWPDSKKAEFVAAEQKAKAAEAIADPAENPDH